MNKIPLAFLLITLIASACSLPAALVKQIPTPYDGGTLQPPAVVLLAQQALASELGISLERVTVAQLDSAKWEDTCLELPASGETCQPAEIDGYLVVMRALNQEYVYHTDLSESFRREPLTNWSEAALQSRQLLAGLLGYNPDEIQILSEQSVTFVDSCLDIHIAEAACSQLRTAGTVIQLQAGEYQYTFHSALSPVAPVLAEAAGASTSTPLMTWSRQGGNQQYCDDLLLYLSGWAVQYACRGTTGQAPGVLRLSPGQQRQLLLWMLAYRPFEHRQTSLDGVAESMTFFGLGPNDPTFDEKVKVAEFAAQILKPPATPVPTVITATP